MMKLSLAALLVISSLFVLRAQEKGVSFQNDLSWEQVLAKAKTENKLVFVDCLATWCGPCKAMDKDVYSNDSVGDYFNDHFVSVKMQMDTSAQDNDAIKARYADAHYISGTYKVNAYPSFLFFDNDGNIVHENTGYQKPADLIRTGQNALDPDKQYYTLLKSYQEGKKDYAGMPELARTTKMLGDKRLSQQIAADYMHGYLEKLSEDQFLLDQNQDFMAEYPSVITSKDRIFHLCMKEPGIVDAASHHVGGATEFATYIICKEEMEPKLKAAYETEVEPDWKRINDEITKKYGANYAIYASGNIINERINWYMHTKDHKDYAKWLTIKVDKEFKKNGIKNDPGSQVFFNDNAFNIFLFDDNKKDLETALIWMKKLNQMLSEPPSTYLDTEANLLYKLGRKEAAIKREMQAVSADPKDKEIAENLKKMHAGQPTWSTEGMK
jgi:thioredoxin-related protein